MSWRGLLIWIGIVLSIGNSGVNSHYCVRSSVSSVDRFLEKTLIQVRIPPPKALAINPVGNISSII